MKVSYDREADVLMVETTDEGTIEHVEHTGPFIIHLSEEGELILLEILDASEFLSSVIKVVLREQEQELTLVPG